MPLAFSEERQDANCINKINILYISNWLFLQESSHAENQRRGSLAVECMFVHTEGTRINDNGNSRLGWEKTPPEILEDFQTTRQGFQVDQQLDSV